MITVNITKKQIEKAEELYDFYNLKGSFTKGTRQIYGALGEVICYDNLKAHHTISIENTYDYDLIVDNLTVDVKSKNTTVYPKPHYFCSISSFNPNQKCDYYFFTRIMKDFSKGFLLGYIKKEEFFKSAVFYKKCDKDPTSNIGFTFKDSGYHVPILNLKKFKKYT